MTSFDGLVNVFMNSHLLPDELYKELLSSGIPKESVDAGFEEFKRLTGQIRKMFPPALLSNPNLERTSWYSGADRLANAKFWPALKAYLQDSKAWSAEAVQSIHRTSDTIVSWLEHPSASKFQTRGLVVGYVQSGKTANFTAVIAKAADAGYRFFIVLSGTKVSLRSQTQRRLEKELVSLNNAAGLWFTPTSSSDFKPVGNPNYFLNPDRHGHILLVVKKNASILKKLTEWLSDASEEMLNRCPFLIIDDEADEASINTSPNQAQGNPESYRRTAINDRVIKLLKLLPKAAYIGYTATPFASVLIDPRSDKDLYPRDFIVALPKPEGHFGTEQIFGRERLLQDETEEEFVGLDVIRIVLESELPMLQPAGKGITDFIPDMADSLVDAVHYFWLGTAARWFRGQRAAHSTMLVHTSQKIDAHEAMHGVIEAYRANAAHIIASLTKDVLLNKLRTQWEDEQKRLNSQNFGIESASFDDLQEFLGEIIAQTQIVVDNSRSEHRLDYENGAQIQIAIGGNTLSRGLTLEGLIVSYFVRAANAYDTLLQMGRWFGYRPGYEDLPRIWMTEELRGFFFDLATVEAEIREDIERYAKMGMTPTDFGVRIRTHQSLEITARAKMQHAVPTNISYDENNVQTVLYNHKDAAWLKQNIQATDRFVRELTTFITPTERSGHQVFYGVPVANIMSFLGGFAFHPNNTEVSGSLLQSYIRRQNGHGSLTTWNVVLRGVTAERSDLLEMLNLGGVDVPLLTRTRRARPVEHANIGVLMTRGDTGADLPAPRSSYTNHTANEIRHLRQTFDLTKDRGGLVIYAISKDSKPKTGSKLALEAADHLIGLGIVFPPAAPDSVINVSYVTVDLEVTDVYMETDTEDEEDA